MVTNSLQNNEVKAVSKYIRMSPSKVRRVLRQIQGKSYKDALILLEFMPYASCEPIIKVLRSAAANARTNQPVAGRATGITVHFGEVVNFLFRVKWIVIGLTLCHGKRIIIVPISRSPEHQ